MMSISLLNEMKLDKLNCKTVGNILAFFRGCCVLLNHYRYTFVTEGMKKFEADTKMANDDPSEVNALGKKISNFNAYAWAWKEICDAHMCQVVKAKFDQNLNLQAYACTQDQISRPDVLLHNINIFLLCNSNVLNFQIPLPCLASNKFNSKIRD